MDEKRTTNEFDRIYRERKRSRGRIRITVLNPKDFSHVSTITLLAIGLLQETNFMIDT